MFYENGVNITLDSQGRITLISSATEGSFEFPWKPNSPLFTRWLRVQYSYEPNEGSVSADILLPDGTILFSNIPEDFDMPYLPRSRGAITNTKDGWSVTNATVEEIQMGIIGFVALRFTKTADPTFNSLLRDQTGHGLYVCVCVYVSFNSLLRDQGRLCDGA